MSAEVAQMVDALVSASIANSTKKLYDAKWSTWVSFMEKKGKEPWLHDLMNSEVTGLLLEFMACRVYVHNNQQTTVRGYLAAIKYYHKLYQGWELPTSHCLLVAVGKGIDRIRAAGVSTPRRMRLPLTWAILSGGYEAKMGRGERVIWLGLALSYFLLCRASELYAYEDGLVHPDFCLTRNCLQFYLGDVQVGWKERRSADSVKIVFAASKSDQNRQGCTITRARVTRKGAEGGMPAGAFEALTDLLDLYPGLPGGAPLMTRATDCGWKVVTRAEALKVLRVMVAGRGQNPEHYALHSGRIGGATQLAAQGLTEVQIQLAGRWKSRAFMVYVRDAGEGAKAVSAALVATI